MLGRERGENTAGAVTRSAGELIGLMTGFAQIRAAGRGLFCGLMGWGNLIYGGLDMGE